MPLPNGKKTYYEFLGLEDFESDSAKIKAAYRKFALSNHPDRGGTDDMMRQGNEVYLTLTKEKEKYDSYLRDALSGKNSGDKSKYSEAVFGDGWYRDFSWSFGSNGPTFNSSMDATEYLRKRIRVKKILDTCTIDELDMIENFLKLAKIYGG